MKRTFVLLLTTHILYSCTQKAEQISQPNVQSTLEIFSIDSGTREIVYTKDEIFEASNWSRDDSFLLFNMKGEIYKISTSGGTPVKLNSGFATH